METPKRLRELSRLLERNFEVISEGDSCCYQVSMVQCHAIVEIGRRENISLKEVSEIIRLDKSTTSKVVDELVKRKLVQRNHSEIDRRRIELNLTLQGREVFTGIEEDMNQKFEKVCNQIPKDQQESVLSALEILNLAFASMAGDGEDNGRKKL